MLKLIGEFLKKTKNIKRDTYFWNTLNATLFACQSSIILIAMARTNSLYDVGVFSIADAVASLMLFVGQYGIRRYQASDVNEKYSFTEYYSLRIITCSAMMLVSIGYCIYGVIFKDYSTDKFIIIFLICVLKCIQALADVLHGRLQQKGRLDIAAKASASRIILETVFYIVTLIITRSLLLSTVVCIAVSLVVLLITSVNVSRDYCSLSVAINSYKIKNLLLEGFPLFASMFLNTYICNAPKYAIDTYLSEEIQAYYNFIFMPAFVVGLLANFIFNPIITSYAEVWASNNIKKFRKLLSKQIIVITVLTLLGFAVAYTIGIPVLSMLFSVDLTEYKMELCVVMIGGGMLAYSTFFSTVIIIIRYQKSLLYCYGMIAIAAKLLSGYFVTNYNVMGVALLYAVLMSLLTFAFLIIILVKTKKGKYNDI